MATVSSASCKGLPLNRILAVLIAFIIFTSADGAVVPIRQQQVTRVMVGNVDFGMDLRSPLMCDGPAPNDCDLQRHYALNVDPRGFAAQLQISNGDQLLALDRHPLVVRSHQMVLGLFHAISVEQSFTLSFIDVGEVTYTFFRLTASIDHAFTPMWSAVFSHSEVFIDSDNNNTNQYMQPPLASIFEVTDDGADNDDDDDVMETDDSSVRPQAPPPSPTNALYITSLTSCSGRSNSLQCGASCRNNGLGDACFSSVEDYYFVNHDSPGNFMKADCGTDAIFFSTGITYPPQPFTFYLAVYDVPSLWLTGDGEVFTIATECGGEYKFVGQSDSTNVNLTLARSDPHLTNLNAAVSFCFEESAANRGRFRMVSPAEYLQGRDVGGVSVDIELGESGIEFDLYD